MVSLIIEKNQKLEDEVKKINTKIINEERKRKNKDLELFNYSRTFEENIDSNMELF